MTDAERLAQIRVRLEEVRGEVGPAPYTFLAQLLDDQMWLLERLEAHEQRLTTHCLVRRRCCDLVDHGHRKGCPNAPCEQCGNPTGHMGPLCYRYGQEAA